MGQRHITAFRNPSQSDGRIFEWTEATIFVHVESKHVSEETVLAVLATLTLLGAEEAEVGQASRALEVTALTGRMSIVSMKLVGQVSFSASKRREERRGRRDLVRSGNSAALVPEGLAPRTT